MAKRRNNRKKRITDPRQIGELPTPEQIMKGRAVRDFVTHAETNTKAMAHKVAHDPVEKWRRAGKLNHIQVQTIERMQHAWDVAYGQPRVTGSYTEPSGCAGGALGGMGSQERVLSLRTAVRAIEDEFKGVRAWYSEFERICRFGEHPLDTSGSRERGLTVVRFIADMIEAKKLI